jgi:hypothetical protein
MGSVGDGSGLCKVELDWIVVGVSLIVSVLEEVGYMVGRYWLVVFAIPPLASHVHPLGRYIQSSVFAVVPSRRPYLHLPSVRPPAFDLLLRLASVVLHCACFVLSGCLFRYSCRLLELVCTCQSVHCPRFPHFVACCVLSGGPFRCCVAF